MWLPVEKTQLLVRWGWRSPAALIDVRNISCIIYARGIRVVSKGGEQGSRIFDLIFM